ncbi:MAG: hypothetical protein AMXMBFR84_31380 [Candidatus Hydrogenedentota bacterium]
MMRRVFTLFSVELSKALRSPMSYIGPVLIALLVLGVSLSQPLSKDGLSDYAFVAYVTPLSLNLVGLILLLTYSAGLVSSELAAGTMTTLLTRPVLRSDVLFAKILLGWLYGAALAITAALSAWAMAYLRGDLAGVVIGGEVLYTSAEMLQAYVVGLLLSFLPLACAVLFGIMMSVLVRGPGTAIGLCLGLWLVIDAIKYPLGIAPAVFSTYLERPWLAFANQCDGLPPPSWTPDVYWLAGTSAISAVVFAFVSILVFKRRNVSA